MKKTTLKRIGQSLFVGASLLLLLIDLSPTQLSTSESPENYIEAEVTVVSGTESTQELELITEEGAIISATNSLDSYSNAKEYFVDDKVVLLEFQEQFFVMDHVRRPALIVLFCLFVGLVLIVNRAKGLYSLLSMSFSFLVLFKLVLPLLLQGVDPILSALLGSLLILPAIFYLSHGFNRKTSIAMLGTLITLGITGLLANVFTELSELSGLASEEAGFLQIGIGENINFKGLLLAGMIISILGVLDDVTITQTSVVEQLKASKKNIHFDELYRRSMAVGKDHISSVINTLILVYTGASLPLMLLFMDSSQSVGQLLNLEFMAEEIVRTLIGSMGLILAVPITTLLASFVYSKAKKSVQVMGIIIK